MPGWRFARASAVAIFRPADVAGNVVHDVICIEWNPALLRLSCGCNNSRTAPSRAEERPTHSGWSPWPSPVSSRPLPRWNARIPACSLSLSRAAATIWPRRSARNWRTPQSTSSMLPPEIKFPAKAVRELYARTCWSSTKSTSRHTWEPPSMSWIAKPG